MSALSDMLNEARIAEQRRAMTHSGQYDNDRARAEAWNELRTAPGRLAQGAFTGLVGAPVDIANMALTPIGLGSERPVGGSNYLADLINAPTASAAYQAGTMLPISPEGLALGGAKLAGMAGIFAGKGAKTANLTELLRAEEMAKAGVPDAQIWNQTGWSLNTPDKMPRFEIPDNKAFYRGSEAAGSSYAEDVMLHPELYKQYPSVGAIRINEVADDIGGNYSNVGREEITLGNRNASSTGLHELQHAIQQREGFARGGSPEMFPNVDEQKAMLTDANVFARILSSKGGDTDSARKQFISFMGREPTLGAEGTALSGMKADDILKQRDMLISPEDQYKRLAGEAEARLTQARMNMTPEQRLAQYPFEPDYFNNATGVNLKDLIVRKDGGTAMSVPKTEFELAHEVAQRNSAKKVGGK